MNEFFLKNKVLIIVVGILLVIAVAVGLVVAKQPAKAPEDDPTITPIGGESENPVTVDPSNPGNTPDVIIDIPSKPAVALPSIPSEVTQTQPLSVTVTKGDSQSTTASGKTKISSDVPADIKLPENSNVPEASVTVNAPTVVAEQKTGKPQPPKPVDPVKEEEKTTAPIVPNNTTIPEPDPKPDPDRLTKPEESEIRVEEKVEKPVNPFPTAETELKLPEEATYDMPDWFALLDINEPSDIFYEGKYSSTFTAGSTLPSVTGVSYTLTGQCYIPSINYMYYINGINEIDERVLPLARKYMLNAKLLQYHLLYTVRHTKEEDKLSELEKVILEDYAGFGFVIEQRLTAVKADEVKASRFTDGYVEIDYNTYSEKVSNLFNRKLFLQNPNRETAYASKYIYADKQALFNTLDSTVKTAFEEYIAAGTWDLTALKAWDSVNIDSNGYVLYFAAAYFAKTGIPANITGNGALIDYALSYMTSDTTLQTRLSEETLESAYARYKALSEEEKTSLLNTYGNAEAAVDSMVTVGDFLYGVSDIGPLYLYVKSGTLYICKIQIGYDYLLDSDEDVNGDNAYRAKAVNRIMSEFYPKVKYTG